MTRWGLAVVALASLLQPAFGATLSLAVESEAIHANMPFTLTLSAKGFEEEPVPEPPTLAIDGCEVTYLGVSPNVSTQLTIINNRRSEWRDVTFVYRWRVLAPAAGRYAVPGLRLEQGDVSATSPPASFNATDVPGTSNMIVRMRLPERPVWVGETFDATLQWLLAQDVNGYQFSVPLFDVEGAEVDPGQGQPGAGTKSFGAGANQVNLPLARSSVTQGGKDFTRFSFAARVTLNRAGVVDLSPVRVVAQLQSGSARDSWGFRRPRYELFRAEGERRRLAVRPLPVAGRPSSFVNAIGGGFSIDVQASRTVVSVGEPVELTVRLRGEGALTGLSLPPLGGPDALPTAHFHVPDGGLAGQIDQETNSKRFTVTVRVKSAEVREIPPISFSYFDPAAGEYRTVESQPVALSVDAGQLVGVADVISAPSVAAQAGRDAATAFGFGAGIATLVGADMSLSAPHRTFAQPWGTGDVRLVMGALYGVPISVVLVAVWLARSGARRARNRTVRQAMRAVEKALAGREPARQTVPAIVAAMRRLADVAHGDYGESAAILDQLETRAFDPAARHDTVPAEVLDQLRRIARRWTSAPRSELSPAAYPVIWAFAGLVAFAGTFGVGVTAVEAAERGVEEVRQLYRDAMAEPDRLRRIRLFTSAEGTLRLLAAGNADAPELQVDWGNAALGAQDVGRAVLAYRRALTVAPDNDRALANLEWLRDRLPAWLPRPAAAGALDSLLFWRDRLTAVQLHVIGGIAFAGALLLLAPWRGRPRWLIILAVPGVAVWLTATGSALLAGDTSRQAVVLVDGVTLRSADSAGAPPTFANPLPAATELTVVEPRDAWVRVMLADGTRGWLATSAVERIVGPDG